MGDKEVYSNQSQRNESATFSAQSSITVKNIGVKKRNYALVVASKPAKIPEKTLDTS